MIDVREKFRNIVIEYFLKSYQQGETPNPCIVCNKRVKFKVLFDKLRDFNASFIATGHYAKTEDGKIFVAEDEEKDQSYFLWALEKKLLKKSLFPLAELTKMEVREKAHELNLPTASVRESQEVCFVDRNLKSYLEGRLNLYPGDIENTEGKKLGTHVGLPVYTIGQRKGIGLSGGPYYVLEKDIKRNVLVVTKNRSELEKKEVCFREENFFEDIDFPLSAEAKIRYNAPRGRGVLNQKKFEFSAPQTAIAGGQSIVFYKGNQLLGGGIIN